MGRNWFEKPLPDLGLVVCFFIFLHFQGSDGMECPIIGQFSKKWTAYAGAWWDFAGFAAFSTTRMDHAFAGLLKKALKFLQFLPILERSGGLFSWFDVLWHLKCSWDVVFLPCFSWLPCSGQTL
jgi:hypothetical protein